MATGPPSNIGPTNINPTFIFIPRDYEGNNPLRERVKLWYIRVKNQGGFSGSTWRGATVAPTTGSGGASPACTQLGFGQSWEPLLLPLEGCVRKQQERLRDANDSYGGRDLRLEGQCTGGHRRLCWHNCLFAHCLPKKHPMELSTLPIPWLWQAH